MTNLNSWNKKDVKALKSVLNQFIAHIRFFEISTTDFYKNIWSIRKRKRSNSRIPKDSKYNFSLIYQGSRDGFDTNIMRRNCNGQGACILIIKTNENGTIIGGYNPIGWKYYEHIMHGDTYWSNTTESFIFSMGDGSDLNDFKISRVVNSNCAIFECNNQNILLNFGNSDLVINNNTGTCNRHCYESSILDANNFTIKEMEIHKFISGE
ncbi:2793_t:CDS:2 [Funneliformis geosporum]|nr:2793_t:CDS:2 [Funneliformis geosporum]